MACAAKIMACAAKIKFFQKIVPFSIDKHYMLCYTKENSTIYVADTQISAKKGITMIKVNVKNGTLEQQEIDAYVKHAIEANPGKLVTELDIDLDGDYVNLTYHFGEIPFDRIRRITGYLVGTLDRFNNAKRAEVEDRVKHSVNIESEDDIYISA